MGLRRKTAILALLYAVLATPSLANRAADTSIADLSNLLTNCWNAVDGGGLAHLEEYGMAFDRHEESSNTVNAIWKGNAVTDLGHIGVQASHWDDGILFDCTLLTYPTPAGADPIEYYEAQDTLAAWFAARYEQPHYHDTFPEYRLFATVRCDPKFWTISANAMTMAPFIEEILVGASDLLTGELRFAVYRTNPARYEVCSTETN